MTEFSKDNTSIEQEIEWLRTEISQDQEVIDSGSESSYQTGRIMENEEKLNLLLEEQKKSC